MQLVLRVRAHGIRSRATILKEAAHRHGSELGIDQMRSRHETKMHDRPAPRRGPSPNSGPRRPLPRASGSPRLWKVVATLGAPFFRPRSAAPARLFGSRCPTTPLLSPAYIEDEKVVAPGAQAQDDNLAPRSLWNKAPSSSAYRGPRRSPRSDCRPAAPRRRDLRRRRS